MQPARVRRGARRLPGLPAVAAPARALASSQRPARCAVCTLGGARARPSRPAAPAAPAGGCDRRPMQLRHAVPLQHRLPEAHCPVVRAGARLVWTTGQGRAAVLPMALSAREEGGCARGAAAAQRGPRMGGGLPSPPDRTPCPACPCLLGCLACARCPRRRQPAVPRCHRLLLCLLPAADAVTGVPAPPAWLPRCATGVAIKPGSAVCKACICRVGAASVMPAAAPAAAAAGRAGAGRC